MIRRHIQGEFIEFTLTVFVPMPSLSDAAVKTVTSTAGLRQK
jgi:hypothetical protein